MARTVFHYGARQSCITVFDDEKNIPEYVIHLIKDTYLASRIISARMIETWKLSQREVQFLIQLEDDQFVRFLRISDGYMELIKQLPKK